MSGYGIVGYGVGGYGVGGSAPFYSGGGFPVSRFVAPDEGIGQESLTYPCMAGDYFSVVSTQRFVSGGMQPILSLVFLNSSMGIISTVSSLAVLTDNGWHADVWFATAPANTAYFQVSATCQYVSGASPTTWEVSNYQIAQNWSLVYAPLINFVGLIGGYQQSREFVFPLYYLSLFTSEYKLAPKLFSWAATLMKPNTDLLAMTRQMYQAFDLSTAVGNQLDIIGTIVGASRSLPFQPLGVNTTTTEAITPGTFTATVASTAYMAVGGMVTVDPSGAHPETVQILGVASGVSFTAHYSFNHAGGVAVTSVPPSAVLGDSDYRILLQAKIAQNQWSGQLGSLYSLWKQIFPGGTIYAIDNQNMTVDITLAGNFSVVAQQMIAQGLIIPRPQGVLYTISFSELPVFGFSGDGNIIGGFDEGHFA